MTPPRAARVETPADTLRRAAAKVRETARSATGGRWDYDRFKVGESWQVGLDNDAWTEGWQPVAEVFGDTSRANSDRDTAAWIALLSPVVAEPLAAWLHWASRCADRPDAETETALALALARVLLGSPVPEPDGEGTA